MQKQEILKKKIFVKSIGSKIVSQNLCQNIVRVKFCNFHTVCLAFRIASRTKLCQHGPLDFLSPMYSNYDNSSKNVEPCLGKK